MLHGNKEMLEYLLGKDGGRRIIHIRGDYVDRSLDISVHMDKREMVQRLVKCGAKT